MPSAVYAPLVIEHFDRPRNVGRLEPGVDTIEGSAGTTEQGAMFHLSATIADGVLAAVRFEAYGCPHCVAAASLATEQLTGATYESLQNWSWREVARALDVPAEKRGRLLILEDAVKHLTEAWRRRP